MTVFFADFGPLVFFLRLEQRTIYILIRGFTLAPAMAAAESAIRSAIFLITFPVRRTLIVEFLNCIQG